MAKTTDMTATMRQEATRWLNRCEGALDTYWNAKVGEVLAVPFKDDKDRFSCWYVESLAYGLKEALSAYPQKTVVMRCLMQVRNYEGRIGGFPPLNMGDGMTLLQHIVEDYLREEP